MSHLNERIAEFVLGEMTGSEAAGAAEHVRQCQECSRQVQDFTRIHQMLKASPDADLPRPVLFEVERPAPSSSPAWLRRWLPPVASAVAASILTAVFLSPAPAPPPADYDNLVIELQTLRGDLDYLKAKRLIDRRDTVAANMMLEQLIQKPQSQD